MKNILLIGLGNIGKIHHRNLLKFNNLNIFVFDIDKNLMSYYLNENIQKETNFHRIINQYSIDGAIVATPTKSHKKFSIDLSSKQIPHIIEKPISLNKIDYLEIQKHAKKNNVFVMCGFVERFHTGVRELKKRIDGKKVLNYTSVRNSIPSDPKRNLDKVKYDVLIHDLDLLNYFVNNLKTKDIKIHENFESAVAIHNTKYLFANLTVNRISQVKRREINIITNNFEFNLDLISNVIRKYKFDFFRNSDKHMKPFIKTDEEIIHLDPVESIFNQQKYFLKNLKYGFNFEVFNSYEFSHYSLFADD